MSQILTFISGVNGHVDSAQLIGGKPNQCSVFVAIKNAANGVSALDSSGGQTVCESRGIFIELSEGKFLALKIEEDVFGILFSRSGKYFRYCLTDV